MKNPPHTYLQKLRGYLDPAVTRKVSAPTSRLSCSITRSFHCCGFSVPLWPRVSYPGFPSCWGNIAHKARREGLRTVVVRWKKRQLFMRSRAGSLNPSICMTHTHLIIFSWRWRRNPCVYLCSVLASLERCGQVLLEIRSVKVKASAAMISTESNFSPLGFWNRVYFLYQWAEFY